MTALQHFHGPTVHIPAGAAQFTNLIDPAGDEAIARRAAASIEKMFGIRVNLDAEPPVPAHLQNLPEVDHLRDEIDRIKGEIAHMDRERRAEVQFKNLSDQFAKKYGIRMV